MVVGDQVMATDPETGEKGPRTVEALIRNTGPHLMVAVGTNKAGVENTTSDTIDATDNHPFWVESRGEWVEAIALQPGDILLDEHGNDILVTELVVTEQDLTAYNLTIEDIHTYYAGNQPTLVHNCQLPKALNGGTANTSVYFGVKDGKNTYAGISNNVSRREAQHGDRFDNLREITTSQVTRGEARAIEQALIVDNSGFTNKINSISPKHAYYDDAVSWGQAWLRENGR